jgi:hypothetical protein
MSTPDQRDPMTPIATVRVVLAEQSHPGVITVLLDLLEAAGLRSKWYLPVSTDAALLDRLAFGGHEATIRNPDRGSTETSADPGAWLHEVQIEIGRALEHRQNWELQIDTGDAWTPRRHECRCRSLGSRGRAGARRSLANGQF